MPRSDSPNAPRGRQLPEPHQWTEFELRTVLSLICRGALRSGDALGFATALNAALNAGNHGRDIPVGEVRALLAQLREEKKGSLAFIERQTSRKLTRTIARVFARELDYDGSLKEWIVDGRRERVMLEEGRKRNRLMVREERKERERDDRISWEEQNGNRAQSPLENGGSAGRRGPRNGELDKEHLNNTLNSPTPDYTGGYAGYSSVTPLHQGDYSLDNSRAGPVGTTTASEVGLHPSSSPSAAPGGHPRLEPSNAQAGGTYSRLDPYAAWGPWGPAPAPAPVLNNNMIGVAGRSASYEEPVGGWGATPRSFSSPWQQHQPNSSGTGLHPWSSRNPANLVGRGNAGYGNALGPESNMQDPAPGMEGGPEVPQGTSRNL